MPPIGLLLGGVDFTDLVIVLKEATEPGAAVTINYGIFLGVAFVIFMAIRSINSMKKKEEEKPAEPAPPAEDIVLLQEIRDLLKK